MTDRRAAISLAAAMLFAGCAYQPGLSKNPITRSASWFSYVGAEDIKTQCTATGPDRYRIVYNGTADTQVRAYDITTAPPGPGAEMRVQVRGELDVSGPIPLDDLLKPWRPTFETTTLSAAQLASIREALRASGFYNPPPEGTRVHSWNFFWIAAACENGRFTYNGWEYGSARFAQVRLAETLAAVDPVDKPFTTPRAAEPPRRDERGNREGYELYVTPGGTKGHITLF